MTTNPSDPHSDDAAGAPPGFDAMQVGPNDPDADRRFWEVLPRPPAPPCPPWCPGGHGLDPMSVSWDEDGSPLGANVAHALDCLTASGVPGQHPDSVDLVLDEVIDGYGRVVASDGPYGYVDLGRADGRVTAGQARRLGRALLLLADQLDAW